MRPDRRGRAVFQSMATSHVGLRTAHVDFALAFVIGRSSEHEVGVSARIDALERTLVALTRQWRSDVALSPARELRLSSDTLASLLAWLEDAGEPDRAALERLGVYASGALTDSVVPEGWLRIQLG